MSHAAQVRILSGLRHERIICLLAACLAPPTICIIQASTSPLSSNTKRIDQAAATCCSTCDTRDINLHLCIVCEYSRVQLEQTYTRLTALNNVTRVASPRSWRRAARCLTTYTAPPRALQPAMPLPTRRCVLPGRRFFAGSVGALAPLQKNELHSNGCPT